MPRLPTLRTPLLGELAHQLRFESPDAARRQLERAEGFALQVLRDLESLTPLPETYPADFVIFRITGLRVDDQDAAAPRLIARDDLLADLPPLIDRLSTKAQLLDVPPGWLNIAELCQRWSVSRKTIERLRPMGLIGRRINLGRGRARQVYGPEAIGHIERLHAESLARAAEFTRMPETTRRDIQRRAARYRRVLGWSLGRCAEHLARRVGRSRESVRTLLIRADQAAALPTFGHRGPLREDDLQRVERQQVRGGRMTAAAKRLDVSRVALYRALLLRRLRRLQTLDLSGPMSATFDRAGAASVLLSPPITRTAIGRPAPPTIGGLLALAGEIDAETAGTEMARAAAYWFLLWSARTSIAGLERHAHKLRTRLDDVETALLWASRIKSDMVRSQIPLIVRTIESRIGTPIMNAAPSAAGELLHVAIDAAISSVDRFDPFKGGRLAAPVSLAVGRAVGRWLADAIDHSRAPTPGRAEARRALDGLPLKDWSTRVHEWQSWLDVSSSQRQGIDAALARPVDAALARVLVLRLGLGQDPPQTLLESGRVLNLPPSRVSALHRRALIMLQTQMHPTA